MLAAQVAGLEPAYRPDVAVVVVGGNDVTHRVPVAESARDLAACVEALQARGAQVVVGTCPDLGALRPVPQPLRSLGSRASRQLAAAQRAAVVPLGAYVVDLATVVGPFFISNPDEMFSLDRFHPSSMGYKRTAKAMLPSVLAALGVSDEVPFGHHAPAAPPRTVDAPGTADLTCRSPHRRLDRENRRHANLSDPHSCGGRPRCGEPRPSRRHLHHGRRRWRPSPRSRSTCRPTAAASA